MIDKAPAVDLTKYIERRFFGERPHIRGRRIPVWVVAYAARDNEHYDVPELMYAYDLSEVEVLAALLYYKQHQEEIDGQEAAIQEKYRHYTQDREQP